jgi:hypothetical protein
MGGHRLVRRDVAQLVFRLGRIHCGANPRADLAGWQVRDVPEQLLPAFLAKFFVLGVCGRSYVTVTVSL